MESSELDRRVEEEARAARARYVAADGDHIDSMRAAVRPLVERLAAAESLSGEHFRAVQSERAALHEIRALVGTSPTEDTASGVRRALATAQADRGDLSADDVDRLRAVLDAGPEESTLAAAERVVNGAAAARTELDREATARRAADERASKIPHLESIIRAQEDAIRGTEKSRGEAWARVVAAEDERDRQATARGALEAEIERIREALGCEPDDVTTSEAARMRGTIAGLRIMLEEEYAKSAGLEGELEEQRRTTTRYKVQLAEVVGREAVLRAALADYRAGQRALARDLLGVEVAGRRVEEVGS